MSEFSSLTTKLVTPMLKLRGFRKRGRFYRSPTSDSALYYRGDLVLKLTFAFHPNDYPYIGIQMQVRDADGIRFDRLHPPSEGGTETLLRAVLRDIESGAGGV
jgi:hypothetical protein